MSISTQAKLCGFLYLLVILFGGVSEGVIANNLIHPHDMLASARHILAAKDLWSLGVGLDLAVPVLAVVQMGLEYVILRPVNKDLAGLALLFNTVSLAVEVISKLFWLMVLPVVKAADTEPVGLSFLLQAHDVAFDLALIFFAGTCLIYGYLIVRSGYLPKLIGVLMAVSGLSYLILCVTALFAEAVNAWLTPWIFIPILLGESSFCLWLLVMGVDAKAYTMAKNKVA